MIASELSGSRIEKALIEFQRAATADEIWKASVRFFRALMPVYNILLGLPSLGVTPLFMRATKPISDVKRFAELAPLKDVIREVPGRKVARMSDSYRPDTADGRAFFEEFLQPMGWRYGAAFLFWNPDGQFLGQLAAIRTEAQGDFTNLELERMLHLHPQVEAAIQRLFALEEAFAAHLAMEHVINELPIPLLAVSWEGDLNYLNKAAVEAVSKWAAGERNRPRAVTITRKIPGTIQAECEELKRDWQRAVLADDLAGATRQREIAHPALPSFRAVIRLVPSRAGRALLPSFTVHFELPPAENPVNAHALAQLSKLTHAEREIARLAAAGHENVEIARNLGVSLSTVRTHLRHIFSKLGITTRSRLAPLYQELSSP
jgi:DNA-binding CsgD family transcriptional regulator